MRHALERVSPELALWLGRAAAEKTRNQNGGEGYRVQKMSSFFGTMAKCLSLVARRRQRKIRN